jgi:hypothetical protein
MVRIGPNEVSIDDVNVHNSVLYCQAPKFMKVCNPSPFMTLKSATTTAVLTTDSGCILL